MGIFRYVILRAFCAALRAFRAVIARPVFRAALRAFRAIGTACKPHAKIAKIANSFPIAQEPHN